MRVLYGGVQLGDANCARFSWGRQALTGADRMVHGFANFAEFGEISFAVNGQADAATKMAVVETILAFPYGDLLVKNDDNSNSVNSVLSAATVDGVRPTLLKWSDKPGAQFHTWRSFACGFGWETELAGLTADLLVEFTESVTVQGGTPLTRVREPINVAVSAADEIVVVPKQKYVVTQTGRAAGRFGPPDLGVIAPPLFAFPSLNPITRTTPKKLGGAYRDHAVEWTYAWEFGDLLALPLPNLWP